MRFSSTSGLGQKSRNRRPSSLPPFHNDLVGRSGSPRTTSLRTPSPAACWVSTPPARHRSASPISQLSRHCRPRFRWTVTPMSPTSWRIAMVSVWHVCFLSSSCPSFYFLLTPGSDASSSYPLACRSGALLPCWGCRLPCWGCRLCCLLGFGRRDGGGRRGGTRFGRPLNTISNHWVIQPLSNLLCITTTSRRAYSLIAFNLVK